MVVLVDEYDKPILDNIDRPDSTAEIREGLKNLYSVLKAQDANQQFVFMTGVTKFSKVSLFSGLNQLNDLTLDAQVKLMRERVTSPRWRRWVRGVMLLAVGLVTWTSGWPEVPVPMPSTSAAPEAPRTEGGVRGSLRVLTWNVLAPALWEEWVEALSLWETPGVRRARKLLAASRRLDRILLSSDLTPLAVGLVTPGPGPGAEQPPSDHYGVWVDIAWPLSATPEPITARLWGYR